MITEGMSEKLRTSRANHTKKLLESKEAVKKRITQIRSYDKTLLPILKKTAIQFGAETVPGEDTLCAVWHKDEFYVAVVLSKKSPTENVVSLICKREGTEVSVKKTVQRSCCYQLRLFSSVGNGEW